MSEKRDEMNVTSKRTHNDIVLPILLRYFNISDQK